MKKKLIFTGVLTLFLMGMVGCQKVDEATSVSPTINPTIKPTVKPGEAKPLEPYYEGLDINKTGKDFIDRLSIIINKGAVIGSYSDAYDALTITDADPLNPDNILCFYTGVSYPKGINGNDRKWNREHVWAKSHGFNDSKFDAYRDLHHLRATEATINSTRNNKDFDEVSNHNAHADSDEFGNKWTDDVFEPRDEVKGDVARMMFYMTVKYSSGDLKLTLVDNVPTNTSKGTGEFGSLKALLKWHEEDPVSIEEVRRHEEVYRIQHNRNPFIDHPEFVKNVFNYDAKLPDSDVNMTDVERVQEMINALPSEITNDNKKLVKDANEAYDKLTLEEKKLIDDSKLIEALIKLEELESSLKPEVPKGVVGLSLSFDNATGPVSNKYAQNGDIVVNDKHFFTNSYYIKGGFRFGNSKDKGYEVSLDKFGLAGYGSYIEEKFETENALSISIEAKKTYFGYEGWAIYFTESGTNTYTKLSEGTNASGMLEATLEEPKNGHFTLVLKGTDARMDLGSYKIGVKE